MFVSLSLPVLPQLILSHNYLWQKLVLRWWQFDWYSGKGILGPWWIKEHVEHNWNSDWKLDLDHLICANIYHNFNSFKSGLNNMLLITDSHVKLIVNFKESCYRVRSSDTLRGHCFVLCTADCTEMHWYDEFEQGGTESSEPCRPTKSESLEFSGLWLQLCSKCGFLLQMLLFLNG